MSEHCRLNATLGMILIELFLAHMLFHTSTIYMLEVYYTPNAYTCLYQYNVIYTDARDDSMKKSTCIFLDRLYSQSQKKYVSGSTHLAGMQPSSRCFKAFLASPISADIAVLIRSLNTSRQDAEITRGRLLSTV